MLMFASKRRSKSMEGKYICFLSAALSLMVGIYPVPFPYFPRSCLLQRGETIPRKKNASAFYFLQKK